MRAQSHYLLLQSLLFRTEESDMRKALCKQTTPSPPLLPYSHLVAARPSSSVTKAAPEPPLSVMREGLGVPNKYTQKTVDTTHTSSLQWSFHTLPLPLALNRWKDNWLEYKLSGTKSLTSTYPYTVLYTTKHTEKDRIKDRRPNGYSSKKYLILPLGYTTDKKKNR